MDDGLNLKLGRFAVSDDFAAVDCLFQRLVFCGSQPGNYVNSIYNGPISRWAAHVRYRLSPAVYVQVGAFNVNPSNLDNDNGLKLNTHGTTGAFAPVELVWSPTLNQLPGEYCIGYYHSTAQASDVYKDEFGQTAAGSSSGNADRTDATRHDQLVVAEQQLTSVNGDTPRGLTLTASATFQDRNTTAIDSYQKLGRVYKGLF